MHRWGLAVPILPGKEAEIPVVTKYMADHRKEYEASRRRAGVTLERVYVMPTPNMGSFVAVYFEGEKDAASTLRAQATSGDPFDKWFFGKLKEIHGVDFTQPPPGPPPELLAEWWDPDVTTRKRGLAFTAPVAPGKTDAGRAFAKEAFLTRRSELQASRRALGHNGEVVILNSTPQGDVVVVYLEGNDPAEGNRKFAASTAPYDVWFKTRLKEIFPPFIDFNVPLPPIQQVWDWQRAKVTA